MSTTTFLWRNKKTLTNYPYGIMNKYLEGLKLNRFSQIRLLCNEPMIDDEIMADSEHYLER